MGESPLCQILRMSNLTVQVPLSAQLGRLGHKLVRHYETFVGMQKCEVPDQGGLFCGYVRWDDIIATSRHISITQAQQSISIYQSTTDNRNHPSVIVLGRHPIQVCMSLSMVF